MPLYEFRCGECGHELEVLQKLSDPAPVECPACHQPALQKKLTAAGFQLKGTGWYVTDFRGGGGTAAPATGAKGEGDAAGAAPAAGAADAKPAAAGAGTPAPASAAPAAPAAGTTGAGGSGASGSSAPAAG